MASIESSRAGLIQSPRLPPLLGASPRTGCNPIREGNTQSHGMGCHRTSASLLEAEARCHCQHQENEARLSESGEAHPANCSPSEKTREAPRLRSNPTRWVSCRQRRYRKSQQADLSCPSEAAQGMVGSEQSQQHPQTQLCQIQRHLRKSHAATTTEGSQAQG